MTPRLVRTCLPVLLLATLLNACGGGDDSGQYVESVSAATATAGYVTLVDGVSGAEVRVIDDPAKPGKALALGATNAHGMYLMNPRPTGADFRIEAAGGILPDGTPFDGRLVAEIRGYDGERVYVNAVTTLVARYLAAHPQSSLAQAEDAVRRFLVLPAWQSLRVGFEVDTDEYSDATFLAAQVKSGLSPDAFIASLVAEMDGSPDATHAFAPTGGRKRGAGGVAAYVGEALVSGALGEIGGQAMSLALGALGLGDTSAAQLQAIQLALAELKQQLDRLTAQIENIQSELKTVQVNQAVFSVLDLISNIKNLNAQVDDFAHVTPDFYAKDRAGWDLRRAKFYNSVCKILDDGRFGTAADVIDTTLRGKNTNTALIDVMMQKQTLNRSLFNYQDSQDLYAVRMFWETVQAQLFNVIDIYLAVGVSDDNCNSNAASKRYPADQNDAMKDNRVAMANAFKARQLAQVAMWPSMLLPENTAIDFSERVMVRTDPPEKPRGFFPLDLSEYVIKKGGYSVTQDSAWNYANIYLDSAASPLPPKPFFLRTDWRLINRHQFMLWFNMPRDKAVARGWPASSPWATYPVIIAEGRECANERYDWPLGIRNPSTKCSYWQGSNNLELMNKETDTVLAIAVRPLRDDEDYVRLR